MKQKPWTKPCEFCGADVHGWGWAPRPISCGEDECEKYARDREREELERAQMDAAQDSYERYR